jgi:ribosomal protein L11
MGDVKAVFFLFIRSQMADSGPPLGTVLGNVGINASKFCKEFNEFTQNLPSYFILKVKIFFLEDKSYNFFVFLPTTGYLISILRYQRLIKTGGGQIVKENCISLKSLVQLSKFKFPVISLMVSIKIILGSVKSSGLKVSL